MDAIRAKVRGGRIETDVPIDLPDGTELLIYSSDTGQNSHEILGNTPEGLAIWLRAYDALDPLILTKEDRAAIESAKEDQKAWELASFEERARRLQGMWE